MVRGRQGTCNTPCEARFARSAGSPKTLRITAKRYEDELSFESQWSQVIEPSPSLLLRIRTHNNLSMFCDSNVDVASREAYGRSTMAFQDMHRH